MSITIDQAISVQDLNNVTVSGTFSVLSAGVSSIDVFQNGIDQGPAALNPDGTWTFNAFIPDGSSQQSTTAVLTDPQGKKTTSAALGIVTGQPLPGQIASALASDMAETATVYGARGRALYDLTEAITAEASPGMLAHVIGRGAPSTRYEDILFLRETIDNFNVAGRQHDTLNLADSGLQSLAQVLQHTTMNGGSATIHIDSGSSVTLTGVTKQQIAAHPNAFVFTGGHILS